MYKKLINYMTGNESMFILRKSDGANIPKDEANRDYQEYLEWVADGGVPEEADA
jgi:hypothetical protein